MRLMIRCPNTGQAVPTGIAFGDRMSFETNSLSNNALKCEACGQMHTWNKEDAFLEDDGPGTD